MKAIEIGSCSKSPVTHNDYMGLLAELENLDKDFVRDTIAKFLENVMKGEQTKRVLRDHSVDRPLIFQRG